VRTATAALEWIGVAAVAWIGLVGAWAVAQTATPGAIRFEPCRLEHPAGLAAVAAECGTLTVAEDPDAAGGRTIDLRVARVPAVGAREGTAPLFLFAGGPGGAATDFYAATAPAFARIHRDRDIVLIDQRGTGRSNPLTCEFDEDLLLEAGDAEILAASNACLAELSKRADVAQYTTSRAVVDVEAVRAALGVSTIDLYGVSYGTRVAVQYARRFRERVGALILDGVVAPERILGPDIALIAEAALAQVLARCASEAACSQAFGDPAVDYRALLAALRQAAVPVALPDPRTAAAKSLKFSHQHLAAALRLSTYNSASSAILPLALAAAHESGNFVPLATQYLLATESVSTQLAYGMHNSVICAEDAPRFGASGISREALEATYLGAAQLDGLELLCRDWPRGPVDPDLHAPFVSDVPALLLSGGADPVTPAADAERLVAGLANGRSLVIPAMGHGQLDAPCVDRLMAEFLARRNAADLDVACLAAIQPMPFFITAAGPAP
jgi:pimeloyl-ACP methyl ester carboxylesterase